jgi:hypothetical protein
MPMQFTKTAWLQRHNRSSNGLGDGERRRVNDAQGAAVSRHYLERVIPGVVDEGGVAGELSAATRDGGPIGWRALDKVGERRGYVPKDGLVEAKVLGENVLGDVGDPVIYVEGLTATRLADGDLQI